jgi:hypothetical protein
MSKLAATIRTRLKIRPGILALCIIGLGGVLIAPAVFGGDQRSPEMQYIVYDDISNLVKPGPDTGPVATDPGEPTGTPGNNGGGQDNNSNNGNGSGHDNNGHGNNADGVDVSNPGQGQGGPNGQGDPSCDGSGPCVDDENGNHGNGGN